MKLFQYIASIFKPRLSKSKTDNNEDNIAADIKFLLDKDNNPYVKISISDTSLESADKFAALLYDINKGLYLESMVQVLIEMGGQDININKYVKRIFKEWYTIEDKVKSSSSSSEPYVKPTDFFKALKNGT
jgi:hypothetical protein